MDGDHADDIGSISLLGEHDGLIDSSLWLGAHWVKQLDLQDMSPNGLQTLDVAIFPRVGVVSKEGMSKKIVWRFNVPFSLGLMPSSCYASLCRPNGSPSF